MGKFKPGTSGNPQGRPKGTGKIEQLRDDIRDAIPEIVTAMVEQAKAGDVSAARLLLERTIPAVRPVQEPVAVDLAGDTLTAKAGAILDAVARAELAPSDAKALLDALAAVAKIQEIDELTQRIEALEARS